MKKSILVAAFCIAQSISAFALTEKEQFVQKLTSNAWSGITHNAWTPDYKVVIKFNENGTYTARGSMTYIEYLGINPTTGNKEQLRSYTGTPAFYWAEGNDETFVINKVENGIASGSLNAKWELSGTVNPLEIREMKIGSNSYGFDELIFTIYYHYSTSQVYGPLTYKLTHANIVFKP